MRSSSLSPVLGRHLLFSIVILLLSASNVDAAITKQMAAFGLYPIFDNSREAGRQREQALIGLLNFATLGLADDATMAITGYDLSGNRVYSGRERAAAGVSVAASFIPIGRPAEAGARVAMEAGELFVGETRSIGFKSFDALKRYLGSPGEGNVWHHLVEQSQIDRFGPRTIHNTHNVISVPDKLNADLNALYSSIRRDITGSDLTIRQWLRTRSLQQNYDFGRAALVFVNEGTW